MSLAFTVMVCLLCFSVFAFGDGESALTSDRPILPPYYCSVVTSIVRSCIKQVVHGGGLRKLNCDPTVYVLCETSPHPPPVPTSS